MKSAFSVLLAAMAVAILPAAGAHAQTGRKPVAKPVARPALRPAAKPAVPPPPRPVARPVPAPEPVTAPISLETVLPTTFTTGPFEAGINALNLGIGVGNRYNFTPPGLGGRSSVLPAFSLFYERGLLAVGPGVVGVGVFAGYQGARYTLNSGDKWQYTDVIVTLRGAFHYPVTPEFDAYGGAGLGLRYARATYEGSGSPSGTGNSAELAPGLFVGGRYFLLQNAGVFAELGYDQTYLKIGLTAKF